MARTIVGVNDPIAVKKYAATLAVDVAKESYVSKKLMGKGPKAKTPVQMLTDLEDDAGEQITYDLSYQLTQQPTEGDEVLAGKEEELRFATDNLYIDQMRGGVSSGGRMTRKRTLHNLREVGRARQSEWWARNFDELFFMYASGARGINAGFIYPTTYPGFAGNNFTAPDADHILYAGAATNKASMTAADKFSLNLIDRAKTHATMMGGGSENVPQIQPIMIEGGEHFCVVMSPWDEYNVRTDVSTGQWLDIQKAATGAEGRSNPIFRGSLGMYNNVILHSHKNVIRFADYGAGADVSASRSLFMGRQAVIMAFGSPGSGLRFDWHEETEDRGNQLVIDTHTIFGLKKCTFDNRDFGMMVLDSAAAQPA